MSRNKGTSYYNDIIDVSTKIRFFNEAFIKTGGWIQLYVGELYKELGSYDEALKYFQQMHKIDMTARNLQDWPD